MTEFLIKRFIKDDKNTDDRQVRAAYGILGSIVGIVCNLMLFALKFFTGLAVGSTAVMADAMNNLSDSASSLISLFGAKAASKPADREHPFGHGRIEYIAAFIVAIVVIEVGLSFFKESFGKILHPEEIHSNAIAVLLLVISIGIKLWLSSFHRNLGKKIQSDILKATAADSLFDAITTAVTILSLLVFDLAHINIDGISGLAVSVLVIWGGFGIAKDTFSPLIGQKMDPDLEQRITALVKDDPAVISVHDLVIHSYGPGSSMATIHIEVSDKMSLKDAHTTADNAEKRVLQELGVILVVHVDPVDMEDTRIMKIRGQITRILKILDTRLSFHDLQVTFDENENLICFDLVVPYAYRNEDENRVLYQVMAFLQELNPKNHCMITIDRGVLEDVREGVQSD